MTKSDRNVIRFPDRGSEVTRQQAADREFVDDPAALAQVLDLAGGRGMLPNRRQPELPPAPARAQRYRVRVDLQDARPPIWRRLELASDLSLADVHEVLQTAMGWTDSHLHQFLAGPERDHTVQPFLTDFDEEEGDEGVNERGVRLDQVLVAVGDRLFYDYDFGDGWEHTIQLEQVEEHDASASRARVLGGGRSCPPENCGGMSGYQDLLASLADGPADADQRERLEWLGPFDPDAFSAEETDRLLQLTMSSIGGSALLEASLVQAGSAFSDVLAELVARSAREPKPLASLIATSELTRLEEPDLAAKTQAVRPWLHLLEVVGTGIALTPAGWLPPKLVHQVATDLDLLEPWMGKGNREQNLRPVRLIRETATALGLLRKRKGELLPTAAGTRLAGDPGAMWRHVAASLPLGRKAFERDAGAIMLLAVAAGESPYDGMRRLGPDLLWSAGWSDPAGSPADDWAAIEYARPTWDVLRVAGCDSDILRREPVPDAARQLARAALRDG